MLKKVLPIMTLILALFMGCSNITGTEENFNINEETSDVETMQTRGGWSGQIITPGKSLYTTSTKTMSNGNRMFVKIVGNRGHWRTATSENYILVKGSDPQSYRWINTYVKARKAQAYVHNGQHRIAYLSRGRLFTMDLTSAKSGSPKIVEAPGRLGTIVDFDVNETGQLTVLMGGNTSSDEARPYYKWHIHNTSYASMGGTTFYSIAASNSWVVATKADGSLWISQMKYNNHWTELKGFPCGSGSFKPSVEIKALGNHQNNTEIAQCSIYHVNKDGNLQVFTNKNGGVGMYTKPNVSGLSGVYSMCLNEGQFIVTNKYNNSYVFTNSSIW